MLGNEKYAGDYFTNKYYIKDHLSHTKLKNKGEVEQVIIKNHHEPIIPTKQYDRIQLIKKMKNEGTYPFYEKLLCPICGRSLKYEAEGLGSKKSVWECNSDTFYIRHVRQH